MWHFGVVWQPTKDHIYNQASLQVTAQREAAMQPTHLKNIAYTIVSSSCDLCNVALKECKAQFFHAT